MTTPGETAAPVDPSAPPDWATVTQDILCPLCDYNLRGLVEPRCPECGYEFSWQALFDDRAHKHPYLFEHHRRKNVRSFFRTLVGSMFPRRFWRTLQPIHKPNASRLLIYWFLVTGITTLVLTCSMLSPIVRVYVERAQVRKQLDQIIANNQAFIIKSYGSVQAYQNAAGYNAPIPPLQYVIVSGLGRAGHFSRAILPCILAWLIWPWLTMLSLLIFRASMRQAKINNVHVLRCVLYGADGWLLAGPLLLILSFFTYPYRSWGLESFYVRVYPAAIYVITAILILMIYRLSCAYMRYLRFPHAIATIVASQVIVVLVLINMLFFTYG